MIQDRQLFRPHPVSPLGLLKYVILYVAALPFFALVAWCSYLVVIKKELGTPSTENLVLGVFGMISGILGISFLVFVPLLLLITHRSAYLKVDDSVLVFGFLGREDQINKNEIEKAVLETHPTHGERIHVYRIGAGQRAISKAAFPEGYAAALEKLKEWGKLREMNSTMDAEE